MAAPGVPGVPGTRFRDALRAVASALPPGLRTRFAPAPTGYLHLGHVANALVVWGVARATAGAVILRIEDHDRQRCRPEYEAALLDDLSALGFSPDQPRVDSFRTGTPSRYRQRDNGAVYEAAMARLDAAGLVYACDCSRATFAAWSAAAHGRAWSGPGCPGRCADRAIPRDGSELTLRVALGGGSEAWTDLVLGSQVGEAGGWRGGGPAGGGPAGGDLPIQDRHGNWTYALCVVVDDMRHGIDLVIRGEDLLDATADQVRLGRLLGRAEPPLFLHHPLIRRDDGRKLSKADGATSVRDLLAAGNTAGQLRRRAAAAIGLPEGMQ